MNPNTGNPGNFLYIQVLGMVNAMKTGNPQVDMLIAMALPYLISMLTNDLQRWIKKLSVKKVKLGTPEYERSITHRSTLTSGGSHVDIDQDNYNLCLIKAIQLYVHANCKPELREAEMHLTMLDNKNKNNNNNRRRAEMSTSALLKSFSMVERPMSKQWLDIGSFEDTPIKFYVEDTLSKGGSKGKEDGGGDGGNAKIRDITIRVKSNSKEAINSFLKIAFDWYVDQLQNVENTDRFLFDLEDYNSRNGGVPNFRRYKLGDDKTFESLFSRQCHDLLTIVDQFESKSGKYRIKGYPHKLGLLLTGPPGTGKTSLIKALAHYTGRHIVNVPLSRISTNASLMSLLFNKRYMTNDSGAYSSLDFNRIIYVFEDVDASSDVVKSRKLIAEERANAAEEARKRAAMFRGDAEVGTNTNTKPVGAALGPPVRSSCVNGGDSLNLMGLLNALDGVVDTPGRIVIMTTNHPEILDGALIRPGRIDKRLDLGYMIGQDMIDMIEHYFEIEGGLDVEMKKRIEDLIEKGLEMTAAELEYLAIEHETVDELVKSLEKRDLDGTDRTVSSDSSSCNSDSGKASKE
ncbi:unnamed protein product [Cylindrotheca closterium]|uniref:AAA+ ATPase domain-containing protein n=1 Tax=Cylindrotheca closterium TaxID=2856 RepID=A0AAD2CWP0_9STRA|nr:unnamed protein product [Cylindrotheca closterium]